MVASQPWRAQRPNLLTEDPLCTCRRAVSRWDFAGVLSPTLWTWFRLELFSESPSVAAENDLPRQPRRLNPICHVWTKHGVISIKNPTHVSAPNAASNNWGRESGDTSRLSALSWTDDLLRVFYCLSPMTRIRNKQRLTGDWWKNSPTPPCPHLLRLSLKCQLKTFPLPWGWHISAARLQTARDKRRAGAPTMTIKWCNPMLWSQTVGATVVWFCLFGSLWLVWDAAHKKASY